MGLFTSKIIENKLFYQNGNLYVHWYEKNGKYYGDYKEYHSNSVLSHHCYYDNEHTCCYSKEFDTNGQLIIYEVQQKCIKSVVQVLIAKYKDGVLRTYEIANHQNKYNQYGPYIDITSVYIISQNGINTKIINSIQLF
jgi:hypothetical protein